MSVPDGFDRLVHQQIALLGRGAGLARRMAWLPVRAALLPLLGVRKVIEVGLSVRSSVEDLAERGARTVSVLAGTTPAPPPVGVRDSGAYGSSGPSDGRGDAEGPVATGPHVPQRDDIVARAAEAAQAAHTADAADGVEPVDRDDLPIADFDHLTVGSLRGRLRTLDMNQLRTLRAYEQGHGSRLPILTLLENRIVKLSAAKPADG